MKRQSERASALYTRNINKNKDNTKAFDAIQITKCDQEAGNIYSYCYVQSHALIVVQETPRNDDKTKGTII